MTPRLAVLTDYPEEGWPSMDLCGDMLLAHLPRPGRSAWRPPASARRSAGSLGRLPAVGRRNAAFNADRLLNRFVHFPRYARRSARAVRPVPRRRPQLRPARPRPAGRPDRRLLPRPGRLPLPARPGRRAAAARGSARWPAAS